jgi:hypothetical protein
LPSDSEAQEEQPVVLVPDGEEEVDKDESSSNEPEQSRQAHLIQLKLAPGIGPKTGRRRGKIFATPPDAKHTEQISLTQLQKRKVMSSDPFRK